MCWGLGSRAEGGLGPQGYWELGLRGIRVQGRSIEPEV